MKDVSRSGALVLALLLAACAPPADDAEPPRSAALAGAVPEPDHVLDTSRIHNKFSRAIPPILRVQPGDVLEMHTKEATDGQLSVDSVAADMESLDFDRIHALTGPVFVEGAEPGDVLVVKLHQFEIGAWGWTGIAPGFGFLQERFTSPWLHTFEIPAGSTSVEFDGREIPLRPFAGVLGVAPDTDEMLGTIPPRANGGNMDNPFMTAGTTVYLPVLVPGALFSIGDTHATQGLGEVCGTAIEAPMRVVLQLDLMKGGRSIPEPEYSTDAYHAVTAFGTTLDEAAKKATGYMVDYLVAEHGMQEERAYALLSLVGDLHIAEVVDVPHVLVAMHVPRSVLSRRERR